MVKVVKVGDIVEVNGMNRIVTMVGAGYFQSEPYEGKKEPEVETIVVKNKKGKGKKE